MRRRWTREFVGLALACAPCLSATASPKPAEPSPAVSWSDLRQGPAELLRIESVYGSLSHEVIADLLHQKEKRLFVCYLLAVAGREFPGDGVITISFEIGTSGAVVDASVAASEFGPGLDGCLLQQVNHWKLAETDGGDTRVLFSVRAREEPALMIVCDGGLRGHMGTNHGVGGFAPAELEPEFQPRPGPIMLGPRAPRPPRNVCDDLPESRKSSEVPTLPK